MKYIFISNLSDWFELLMPEGSVKLSLKDSHCPPCGFICENGTVILCFYGGIDIFYQDTYISMKLEDIVKDFTKWYERKYL